MEDKEKIQNFGDMVDAVERLTKPIQEENERLHKHLWWERIILGGIILALALLAYLAPVEMEQGQQFDDGTQSQSYSDGVTGGK